MDTRPAMEALADWFGSKEFKMRDMPRERVEQFMTLAGLERLSRSPNHSQRAGIGHWIKQHSGVDYPMSGRAVRVIVVDNGDASKGCGSIPAALDSSFVASSLARYVLRQGRLTPTRYRRKTGNAWTIRSLPFQSNATNPPVSARTSFVPCGQWRSLWVI